MPAIKAAPALPHAPKVLVQKMSGLLEPFSAEKLLRSLKKAGASDETAADVTRYIVAGLAPGETTQHIYRKAFGLLKKQKNALAARYKLKRAILELGPSGYPFEQFVGEVFRKQGYLVQVGILVQGRCVTHEVDVIAQKGDQYFLMECKFHNRPGEASDVKTALYVNARFHDIRQTLKTLPDLKALQHQMWLVTNTHFTTDALTYGSCAGMQLLSWSYPAGNGLKELIERNEVYPVTTLTTLTQEEKQRLLAARIVLVADLVHNPKLLAKAGLKASREKVVLQEAHALCH